MKIQLLIALEDTDYMDHLSRVLSEKYADSFEVTVCSARQRLVELMEERTFEIAIFDLTLSEGVPFHSVKLPLILRSGHGEAEAGQTNLQAIAKYQRISAMTGQILSLYAEKAGIQPGFEGSRVRVTIVWSPAGGCGKTTVALAYAAQLAGWDKRVVYLDMEPFSSTPIYFAPGGKSLSTVFEKLRDGNAGLLLKGIRREDRRSGIFYYEGPENYEDIDILTPEDLHMLVQGAASGADEVIVDLGSVCDAKTRKALEIADQVFLVTDSTMDSQIKCNQFRTQHSLYAKIAEKIKVIANKGSSQSVYAEEPVINLPLVNASDPVLVYRTLAAGYFQD